MYILQNTIYCYCFTVNPWAISSSGTNSGRNTAGVIQGHLVFVGNSVTIMSPFAVSKETLGFLVLYSI